MTIREVINVLIDAPDKDKPFIVECRKDVLKNHNYEWGQLNITKIVNCNHSSVAEAESEAEVKEKAIEKADEILIMLGREPGKGKVLDYGEKNVAAYNDLVKIARSVGMEITNETAISTMFCVEVMRQLEKIRSQECNELRWHIEKLEKRIKRIMELAEDKRPTEIAYWVNGRCNHCGCEAPKASTPEMGGYTITVPDLTDYCPKCGYKMER